MKKIVSILLVLIMIMGMLAGCGGNNDVKNDEVSAPVSEQVTLPASEEPEEPAGLVMFTDSVGREVEVPANVTCVSPTGALAQMYLLAIAPDLLATVASEYTDNQTEYIPSYLTSLPVVGQFYGTADINFETIAAASPELVIDVGDPKATIVEDMDEITTLTGLTSVHITATLESTPEAFRQLGKLLGREEKGEELAQFCEKILAQTADIMEQVGEDKVRALYCLGDAGQNVLAQTSFHSEVLDYVMDNLAVVDNIASKGTGNETDLEQITVWNPDFIIFGNKSIYATVAENSAWAGVTAIQNGNYIETPYGPYDWIGTPPSINRYLSMIWLTKVLYPEYADFDMYEEIKEYYELFYGYDLSVEQYDILTANAFLKVAEN